MAYYSQLKDCLDLSFAERQMFLLGFIQISLLSLWLAVSFHNLKYVIGRTC